MPAWAGARRLLRGTSGPRLVQPYNNLFIMGCGDSRTAMGTALTGTYGTSSGISHNVATSVGTSMDGFIGQLLGNRIRPGKIYNQGIGGETAAMATAYPRPVTNVPCTGRIDTGVPGVAGNVLTISIAGAGDNISVGCQITGTGITPCVITAILTGTGGVGTYTVDGPAQNVASTGTVQPNYLESTPIGKTIANVASNEAAIVEWWLGTNSFGSPADLAAMGTMIRGLTDPTYVYPGYGAPLPLYNGQPKTLIIYNETRRGITAGGAVANQGSPSNAAQLHAYAVSMMRYSFDSGDATYANPHVVVVDTFDAPTMADLTDTTTYNPKPGLFADGLHEAQTAIFAMNTIAAAKLDPILVTGVDYARLPTTANAANFFIQNPCFTTTTGGSTSLGSNTLVGTVPASWLLAGSGSGLTYTTSFVALGGNLGNAFVVQITGTPVALTNLILRGTASSGQRALFNLATDVMRLSLRSKLVINSGSVYASYYSLSLQAGSLANQYSATGGLRGSSSGYGNNASYPMLLEYPTFSAENADFLTQITPNVSLAGLATGTPSVIQTDYVLGMLAGVAVDITLTLAQAGPTTVTD